VIAGADGGPHARPRGASSALVGHEAGRARRARAAVAAVPVRVLREVLLVVVLGEVEFPRVARAADLGGDAAEAIARQCLLVDLNRIAERVDHPRRGDSVSRSGVGWGAPSRLCRAGGGSASDLPGKRATHGSASRRSCVGRALRGGQQRVSLEGRHDVALDERQHLLEEARIARAAPAHQPGALPPRAPRPRLASLPLRALSARWRSRLTRRDGRTWCPSPTTMSGIARATRPSASS
jgi:hypothetical protein